MFRNKEYVFNGWNNKAVMLLHGATAGSAYLRPLANYLNCNGYTVYGFNLAGHGTTTEDLEKTQGEDFIKKAEKDLAKVQAGGYDKVFLAGLSLGGLTTAYLASNHPELSGIITYAAGLMAIGDVVPQGLGIAGGEDSNYVYRSMEGKTGIFTEYHVHYEKIPISFYTNIKILGEEYMAENMAKKITSPALFMHAADDSVVYPKSSEYLYENCSSKIKELVMLKQGDHAFILNEYRYEPFEKTLEFLNKL
jgi:carboxylesterase